MCIIYKATNKITGKSYIGQTTHSLLYRKKQHIRSRRNTYFHCALRKYGEDVFEWSIVEDNCDPRLLNELEIKYIKQYDTYNNGYNLTFGGDTTLGLKVSEETKKKQSIKAKERYKNKESHPRYGAVFTEDHLKKISGENHWTTRLPYTKEHKEKIRQKSLGEKNHFFGKHHTEQTKQIISNKKLGVVRNEKSILGITPDGEEIIIKGISKFAKENKMRSGTIRKVMDGSKKEYRGWKFYRIVEVD